MSSASAAAVPSAIFACDVCGQCPVQDFVYRCSVCRVWACCHGCQQHVEEPGARWRTFSLEPHEAAHPLTLLRAPVSTAEPPQHSGRLSAVVSNAVQRWFCETLQAAKGGDVNSMELLSQMLNEGYGCQRDTTLARYWRSVAQSRGARRLDGVYDRLP